MDADEESSGSKKQKTKLKRNYKKVDDVIMRNCAKRTTDEEEATAAKAIAANGGEGQPNNSAPVGPVSPTAVRLPKLSPKKKFSKPENPLQEAAIYQTALHLLPPHQLALKHQEILHLILFKKQSIPPVTYSSASKKQETESPTPPVTYIVVWATDERPFGLESVADHRNTGLDPHSHHFDKRESLFLVILLIMFSKDRRLFELPTVLLVLAIIARL
ncbi:hypothetical protein Ahy_A03g015645 [Arachis hypogaea]|uniref:Uncharacterized protein n=1 Tax=Arachis hypogaea TaxID=3818 RepID=A0A445E0W2_ARAHY|nr:hypothetical protein Ahy_A03g015645 [Arachis hypogaea]